MNFKKDSFDWKFKVLRVILFTVAQGTYNFTLRVDTTLQSILGKG